MATPTGTVPVLRRLETIDVLRSNVRSNGRSATVGRDGGLVCEFPMMTTLWDFVTSTFPTFRPKVSNSVRPARLLSTVVLGVQPHHLQHPSAPSPALPLADAGRGNTEPRRWHPPSRHAPTYRSGTLR